MGVIQEFKDFALKGNVADMAIGIIMGAAFGKIVSSLVADVMMPPIGKLMGGVDFSNLSIKLQDKVAATEGKPEIPEVALKYGAFINTVIDFLIVAFVIFLLVKIMNTLKKKQEAAPPPGPTPTEKLLAEIRDTLKERR